MRTLLKTLGIVAAIVLAWYIVAVPALSAQHANAVVAGVDDPDVVLHVKGLACESCARTMKSALLEIEGIDDVEVFLEGDQRVHVQLHEGASVDEETLRKAVEDCGFVLERVELKESQGADE